MIREHLSGHRFSAFLPNPIVKAYIISESFLWSAWDFVIPIFSIFVIRNVSGGSIEAAASGYSIYLAGRVVFEPVSGRMLRGSTDRKKFLIAIFGILCISFAYLGFIFSKSVPIMLFFYGVAGFGHGISSPARNALFSMHLDKNKEATEWGIADSINFLCMALATALGGFIATQYGFTFLFVLSAILNFLAIGPYVLEIF